jgi:hypothetical protein
MMLNGLVAAMYYYVFNIISQSEKLRYTVLWLDNNIFIYFEPTKV